MSDNHYDVIIIGTGAGGGTLAYRLAPSGKRILLLERGGYVPREKQNWDSRAVEVIAGVTGKPVKHNDIDRDVWIQGSGAAGVPAEYGEMLRMLTETIASGMGSLPNDNVQKVTGAPPIKFADFARRTAQAWT